MIKTYITLLSDSNSKTKTNSNIELRKMKKRAAWWLEAVLAFCDGTTTLGLLATEEDPEEPAVKDIDDFCIRSEIVPLIKLSFLI